MTQAREWTGGPWRTSVKMRAILADKTVTVGGQTYPLLSWPVARICEGEEAEKNANARLIAASPTMADALQPFADLAEIYDDPALPDDYQTEAVTLGDLRRARAALSLARPNGEEANPAPMPDEQRKI